MESPNERLIRYLQDAHAAEIGIADMFEKFVNETNDTDIAHELFREHLSVTKSQALRLEDRLRELESAPNDARGFFNNLMAKVGEIMSSGHDTYDRATRNLIQAYATEHFEQGMYASLVAYAEANGDEVTADLAEEILSEEEEAALKIFPLIEASAQMTYDAASRTEQAG